MILTVSFILFCTIHTLFWVVLFARLNFVARPKNANLDQLISVIVVFKNELENLKILIPKLLEQDYPNFELILCDDFSNDASLAYVERIDNSLVNVLKASTDLPGKKAALKQAVTFAKGEYILVTDADCYPATKSWISSMSSRLRDNKVVLGYSPHLTAPGWLNKFIRYETFLVALQYLSYAAANIPYMGVGRNLLYKKSLFISSDALDRSPHLISGDDDIFVNAVAQGNNTTINLDPISFVHTYPSKTFTSFIRQKRRHVTTATVYKFYHQVLLALYALSHVMIYLLFIVEVFCGLRPSMIIGFIIVLFIKWVVANKTMKVLQCPDLAVALPILDILMVLYYICLTPATFIKSKNW